ncbi:chemotaxis protein histidine kinase CheA [Streptomyces sp. LBL]|uniref:hypothetical protein n=1 Tax=Streptomyces sp. LBL TaxID=2940562 RepID=UPI0024745FF8|nr:hypothetical protein [Streptomyces sp. LBL]MDH6624840.1 chemotaxis protein histidine kinase CheA [Streptomyces sp. LBL]
MEQRIGSSSQPLKGEPVTGAGFDPAFIPGLTAPAPGAASGEPADAEPAETAASGEKPAPEKPAAGSEVSEPAETSEETDSESAEASEAPDGPVFEASDRRAKIVADHRGVRLALDDQACEFRWDEIGAVETEVPRFGKRLTITVHTPDRRWYPIEIEAESRSAFDAWDEQLDAVLDAYFEDGDEESADEGEATEGAAAAEAAEVAEAAEAAEEQNGGAAEKTEAGDTKAAKSNAGKSKSAKAGAEASDETDAD